jgi:enoyl-CoA hydratase/carnithine racemase
MLPTPRSVTDDRSDMSDLVIVRDEGNVRSVRMNRPDKKNALTAPMYQAMVQAIDGAAGSGARCVVILGAPGAFCAGNDLNDFLTAAQSGALDHHVVAFLHALVRSRVPLVAGVQGIAVGIGTTMLLHCDYVVAGTDARFSTPFVKLGLLPEAASSLLAPRLMGHRRAFAMLVMGRDLDAAAALACGLVNEVVTPSDVDASAMAAANEIAALPPEAVATARELMRRPVREVEERIDEEVGLFAERLKSAEARAAFEAFLTRKR